MSSTNYKEICIWKDEDNCEGCEVCQHIFCRYTSKYRLMYAASFIPMLFAGLTIGFSALSLTLKLVSLIGWIVYMFFFLNVWESHMLCNHCVYYANPNEKTLNCPIDKGKMKTGTYNPGPLTISEKIQFLTGFALFAGFPIPFIIIGKLYLVLAIYVALFALWILLIQTKVCNACVNFACPINRVDPKIRAEFMKRNPLIRMAWEEKGYHFD
ncbi:hypothetical protein [Candidatus Lokiarchaeum ossiferum]|uniref:hypothetical protein n=1 Tax=Candidatus Lokiarchaeum ossiferum TaxID=2951803 RepID=UPI00352ECF8B